MVTSDNPQALEAFEKKLPPDLAKFCTNLSTMQDGRIGKLSQCLDRREADIATLIEGKDYEKEKKVSLQSGHSHQWNLFVLDLNFSAQNLRS